MSIVEEGGPTLDPVLIRRGGYALVIVSAVFGIVALFERAAPLAAADIVLAIATVLVMLWAPELFEISGRRKTRGMNPIFMAPAGLVLLAGVENDFVDIAPLFVAAAAGALLACGVALLSWRRPGVAGPWQFMILVGLIGGALGYGAPAMVDIRFDASQPQPFRSIVSSTHVSHGRSTSYHLSLAPWGPRTTASDVSVSSSFYNQINPGAEVCIGLHGGALSIPWFVVHLCPDQA